MASSESGTSTVPAILSLHREREADAPALIAPDREVLTYGELWRQVEEVTASLRAAGVGRNDRVAVVVPDGPEMAALFVGVAAAAACAPLNPRYREEELDFYLGDLDARALVVLAGYSTPARDVAARRGVPVVELEPTTDGPAGRFRLSVPGDAVPSPKPWAGPDDVALVLHTSGTTSRPKMVPLTHDNICTSAANIGRTLALTSDDRCLCVMPLFHIHGLIGVLLSSLRAGASVFCSEGFLAPRFLDWLDESGATWYSAVPTMHQAVLARAAAERARIVGHRLRLIRSSSASLPPQVMADLEGTFGVPVIESYGMTEASHQMTSNPLPPSSRKPGSVGLAAGPEVAIMDERGRLLGAGTKGEIVIRGANVTRGYEANPEANAKAYTDGWFRTGDEGYLDQEGYLFISGRLKEIINRGGEKIAPREIDEALLAHPSVAQALAFAAPHPSLGEEVAAAVVLAAGATITERQLQEFVAARLADFKIPRRVMFLDEIPKGPTGKLQRIGLAARLGIDFTTESAAEAEYVASRTTTEEEIVAIWAEVLGVERVGIHDDFFVLGGDSILVARVIARVRQQLDFEVPFAAFFAAPTVASLAALVDGGGQDSPVSIPRLARGAPLTPSFTQERMWFLEHLEPGSAQYNRPIAVRLTGELDRGALTGALSALIRRHEVLRARLVSDQGVARVVIDDKLELPLPEADLSELPSHRRDAELTRELRSDAWRTFDLAAGPLVRARLLCLGEDEHVLSLVFHHAVFDGTSAGILLRELGELYDAAIEGRPPRVPELSVQYADWAPWQRERVEAMYERTLLPYWTGRLAGSNEILELPSDRPPPVERSYLGGRFDFRFDAGLTQRLRQIAREEAATLFTSLLAAFSVALHRYTGQEDILIGSPVSGRTHVDVEPLIGAFINTLVLRTDLSGEPDFRTVVARCRDCVQGALAHQELPFERLVEVLQPERDLTRSPLFQVLFQLRNLHEEAPVSAHLEIEELHFDRGVAAFALDLDVRETAGGLECALIYSAELFDAATIERLVGHLETLLRAALEEPGLPIGQLPLLSDAERALVLDRWQGSEQPIREVPVSRLFTEQAARTPDLVAVESEDIALTYAELEARSNQLAQALLAKGVTGGSIVALALPRSVTVPMAMLAIHKAGGVYLPLELDLPVERLKLMLDDACPVLVVTDTATAAAHPEFDGLELLVDRDLEGSSAPCEGAPEASVALGDLAYVIYTSGSTGRPKGVMTTHRGLTNFSQVVKPLYELGPGERLLQFASIGYDMSIAEFVLALTSGATLVVRPDEPIGSSRDFLDWCGGQRITAALPPTALWHQLTADLAAGFAQLPPSLRLLELGGEAAIPEVLARWHSCAPPSVRLVNSYGPTEASIMTCRCDLGPDEVGRETVPIGRPFPNLRVFVLDSHLQPLPAGVPGEAWIGGPGVAAGYLGQAELTAKSFVPDPFSHDPAATMYRTGDRMRWRADGMLEFLGRLDFQVKIRGHRVEPGEIEAVLVRHPLVTRAVVVAHSVGGSVSLIAYVEGLAGSASEIDELREVAARSLPPHAIPSRFVALSELPLNSAGKVDRKRLPDPDLAGSERGPHTPPRSAVERALADIWSDLLGRSHVGVDEEFFELGGHSLLLMQVMARIRERFDVELPVRVLFEATTIADLAAALETLLWVHGTGGEGQDRELGP